MSLVLELVASLKEHFKTEHLANILAGVKNAMVHSYHHENLELFGAGRDHSVKFWGEIIHQALIHHFLYKDIETYGLMSLTEEGRAFLEQPHSIRLTAERTFAEGVDDDDDPVPPQNGAPVPYGSAGGDDSRCRGRGSPSIQTNARLHIR